MGMCPIVLKKLIQREDSSYHIRKILEIIREGAFEVWKERTRTHMLRNQELERNTKYKIKEEQKNYQNTKKKRPKKKTRTARQILWKNAREGKRKKK